MPAFSRSLQRCLAFLLGLFLALATSWFPTPLPAARARSLSTGAPFTARSAPVALPSEPPSIASAQGSAGFGHITRLDQSARAAYAAGNGAVAASLWRQAAEEAASHGGDTLLQARLLSNHALAQLLQGKPEEAQRSLEAGFALLDASARPVDSLHQRTRAQLLHTRARLEFERGQILPALTTWRQVAPLFHQLGASEAELASLINQAEALHSLGNLSEARTLLESVLQRPELSSQLRLKAAALSSLAVILQRQGDVEAAKALAPVLSDLAATQKDDPRAKQQANLALINIWASHDNNDKVQQAYNQAAATPGIGSLQARASHLALLISSPPYAADARIWTKLLDDVNMLPGNATALDLRLNLASSLRLLREHKSEANIVNVPSEPQLRQLLQRCQTDAERLGDSLASSMANGELGALALSADRLDEAEILTQKALRQTIALKMPEFSSRWLWQLALISRKQHNRPAALAAYQQALNELSTLRLDLASSSLADPSSFSKSLEPISREFIDLLLIDSSVRKPSDNDLKRARLVMEELQVAELNDFFRLPCFDASSIARRNEPNVAVVYPMLLPNRLEVIVQVPGPKEGTLRHHSQPIDEGSFHRTVKNLQYQLQNRPSLSDATSLLLPHAQQLHQWLLGDLDADLQASGITQLVFVPDKALRNLPMAVLHDGKGYLADRYAISVAPGMLHTPSTRRPGNQPRVLGAGVSKRIEKVDGSPQGRLGVLSAVDRELEELRNRTGATVLLNEAFTKQALQKALQSRDYSVVHLATHGKFSSNPNENFLITGLGESITVNQLADLLQPTQRRTGNSLDLLILSACEGAYGDDNANLGLAAVAARSGASSTIASLWSVDDKATATFMDAFYRNWLGHKSDGQLISKAQALSLAQAELRKDPDTRHPYYWGAFTLLGDWR
jgi:CHAT domain-containing protein